MNEKSMQLKTASMQYKYLSIMKSKKFLLHDA